MKSQVDQYFVAAVCVPGGTVSAVGVRGTVEVTTRSRKPFVRRACFVPSSDPLLAWPCLAKARPGTGGPRRARARARARTVARARSSRRARARTSTRARARTRKARRQRKGRLDLPQRTRWVTPTGGPVVGSIRVSDLDEIWHATGCKVAVRSRDQWGPGRFVAITGPETSLQTAMCLALDQLELSRAAGWAEEEGGGGGQPASSTERLAAGRRNLEASQGLAPTPVEAGPDDGGEAGPTEGVARPTLEEEEEEEGVAGPTEEGEEVDGVAGPTEGEEEAGVAGPAISAKQWLGDE